MVTSKVAVLVDHREGTLLGLLHPLLMHGTALVMVVLDPLLMSCMTLLVGLQALLMHGMALLVVVLRPLLMSCTTHPVGLHPEVHCPALPALPALLQKGCTALFVGCDPFRPALLVSHAYNMLPASSQALLVRCPALLALLALLQISSIAPLVGLDPLLIGRTALLVVVLCPLLMCLLVGCDPFRPALLVSHACNMLPASSIAPLVSLQPPLMHGTMLLAIVLDPLLVCLSVSSKPFRPALLVFHACNVLLTSSNVLPASSQAL